MGSSSPHIRSRETRDACVLLARPLCTYQNVVSCILTTLARRDAFLDHPDFSPTHLSSTGPMRAAAVVFLLLGLVLPFAAAAGLEECGSDDESWSCTLKSRSAALILAAFIVVSGIIFDFAKETLEEHTKKESRPILHAFFGELMVGGFLSLLSFVLVFSNALTGLSSRVFGEPDVLPEMLEDIHVILFVVFAVFMIQILLLLAYAYLQNKRWRRAEKAILYRPEMGGKPPKHKVSPTQRVEFQALRAAFIGGDSSLVATLPEDFAFSHYLGSVLGKQIAQMVAIPIAVWCSVLCVFVVLWALAGTKETIEIPLFIALIWLLVIVAVLIHFKLRSIYSLLLPSLQAPGLIGEPASLNSNVQLEMESEQLLANRKPIIGDPPYQHIKVRGCCIGKTHNKHESLFWFGRRGPKFLLRCLAGVMFLNALFIAVYGVWFASIVWTLNNVAVRFLAYFLAGVPLLILPVLILPANVRLLVITSKIELMKEQIDIKRTLLEMRTKKIVRTIKLLHSLRMSVMNEHGGKEKGKAEGDGHHHAPSEALSHEKLLEAREVFGRFDSGDGQIDRSELGKLMESMGVKLDEATSHQVLQKIDIDSSGHVNFEEFSNYLALVQTLHRKGGKMSEEDIEHIFTMFDKDGSGEVGIHEFQDVFEELGNPMSIQELNSFIRELDEDDR